jgi:hypothetical protein
MLEFWSTLDIAGTKEMPAQHHQPPVAKQCQSHVSVSKKLLSRRVPGNSEEIRSKHSLVSLDFDKGVVGV